MGSTAYNLAAGGPTVSWRVRCFVLSFIALHHLDSRPLVIGAEEQLTVTNSALVGDCDIQADGQRIGVARPGPLDHGRPGRLRGAPGHLPRGLLLPALPGEVRPAVIRSLEVRDLVVIERAELAPPAGLTAITGETGAGKTVLAQALGLLAGAPADAAAVRPGRPPRAGPGHPGAARRVLGRASRTTTRPLALRELADDESEVRPRPARPGRGPRPRPDRRAGRARATPSRPWRARWCASRPSTSTAAS